MLTISIPGAMRGKGRPRFTSAGGFARAYTDEKTANAETWVRSCAVDQTGGHVLDGPLSLTVEVGICPPASWSKRRRADALAGAAAPTGKPDLDNVVKLIADALNGIVWRDDKQIVHLSARKFYAAEDGTVLRIAEA